MAGYRIRAIFAFVFASVMIPNAADAQGPTPSTINEDDYVRLEVRLAIANVNGPLQFEYCPRQKLWGLDLDTLFGGSKHVTLGVAITGPQIPQMVLTPVTIDRSSSGFLGLNRNCSVSIDQMIYTSPAVSVRGYSGQQFDIAPTYVRKTSASPGLGATVGAAIQATTRLTNVTAEAAKPFQDAIQNLLGSISVGHQETLTKHIRIEAGPVPDVSETTWIVPGAVRRRDGTLTDLVLTARIIPVRSLIAPPRALDGSPAAWRAPDVLSSAFSPEISSSTNPSGTLGGYVEALASVNLGNYRNATSLQTAAATCDAFKRQLSGIGLSRSDSALLIWALTHERPAQAPITQGQIDSMPCLSDVWGALPASIVATKREIDPPPPDLLPATTRQMQATTQINDAFARFFVLTAWTDRQRHAESLFSYPTSYSDAEALVMRGSETVTSPYQWLAMHPADTPYLSRVGCYSYVPASQPNGISLMYAIGELPGSGTQVLLTAAFGRDVAQAEARITSLSVSDTISAEARAAMRAANPSSQCASGYSPAMLFRE